ncbi:hypothetical protein EMCRGX_G023998 [Ephydatia muelleri]
MACATNKLVAKHIFRQFKCASPYDVCSAFGSIGSEIGKHGELKELETAIMGTYRQRVCDLNLQSEDVNPKTSAGKQLLSKFLRAQTMQDLAMALSATKDEKWMTIRMKLGCCGHMVPQSGTYRQGQQKPLHGPQIHCPCHNSEKEATLDSPLHCKQLGMITTPVR